MTPHLIPGIIFKKSDYFGMNPAIGIVHGHKNRAPENNCRPRRKFPQAGYNCICTGT